MQLAHLYDVPVLVTHRQRARVVHPLVGPDSQVCVLEHYVVEDVQLLTIMSEALLKLLS